MSWAVLEQCFLDKVVSAFHQLSIHRQLFTLLALLCQPRRVTEVSMQLSKRLFDICYREEWRNIRNKVSFEISSTHLKWKMESSVTKLTTGNHSFHSWRLKLTRYWVIDSATSHYCSISLETLCLLKHFNASIHLFTDVFTSIHVCMYVCLSTDMLVHLQYIDEKNKTNSKISC